MKIGIVAGEKSGDDLASRLIRALKIYYPDAQFFGLCGPLMQEEGAETIAEMDKISIMGLEGLFGSLTDILSIRRSLYKKFRAEPPSVFIGVDVPDFNLGLEKELRKLGIPTVHLVSPTVWAWRGGRVNRIRSAVDLMLPLFPFEEVFYKKHGVPVEFVGHPMAREALNWQLPVGFRESLLNYSNGVSERGDVLIALLPGSRMSEVRRLAPEMMAAAEKMAVKRAKLRFVIPAANARLEQWLREQFPRLHSSVQIISGQSRNVLAACDLVALASGTAALEAALFAKPMVVMYKVAKLSALVFGHTIQVEHFSMPNHLTDTPVVPELIQEKATAENLVFELSKLLDDAVLYQNTQEKLSLIAPTLALDASKHAARAIYQLVQAHRHSEVGT